MSAALGPWAAVAVILLGAFLCASGETETEGEDGLTYRIVNFNFETVRVTWNASEHTGTNLTFQYRFRRKDYGPCPGYILQHGRTVGCVLPAEGDQLMDFSIRNETHPLLSRTVWISAFLKPSTPRDLHFRWHQKAITVTCSDLPYRGLRYEVQHKSIFDEEWQSTEEDTCNVTIEALDADRCYSFRARVKTTESSYGSDTYPSDWSEVAHRQGGERRDSCRERRVFSRSALVYGAVALLMAMLLPLSLWRLWRVKKLVVPNVPDPKFTFPGLFESHHGNFQEWIKDTQNVTMLSKVEDREQASLLEDSLVVQLTPGKAEAPGAVMTGRSHPPTAEKETAGEPSPLPCRPPPGEEQVSLGAFTFVVGDNAYVML